MEKDNYTQTAVLGSSRGRKRKRALLSSPPGIFQNETTCLVSRKNPREPKRGEMKRQLQKCMVPCQDVATPPGPTDARVSLCLSRMFLTMASECLSCPFGHFCGASGLTAPSGPCSPGYFCMEGVSSPTPAGKGSLRTGVGPALAQRPEVDGHSDYGR